MLVSCLPCEDIAEDCTEWGGQRLRAPLLCYALRQTPMSQCPFHSFLSLDAGSFLSSVCRGTGHAGMQDLSALGSLDFLSWLGEGECGPDLLI